MSDEKTEDIEFLKQVQCRIDEITELMDEVREIGFSNSPSEMNSEQNTGFLVELQSQKNELTKFALSLIDNEKFRRSGSASVNYFQSQEASETESICQSS